MQTGKLKRLCIVPKVSGVGGMVSFRGRLLAGLAQRGVETTDDLNDGPYDAVLLIGGTRQLAGLARARRAGIPIIQRLDGMNWLHRRRPTGLRHWLRAEQGNLLLAFIRRRLASGIVYQSQFVVDWWGRVYGPTRIPYTVIHNGVALEVFTPEGEHSRPTDRARLLLVEGSLAGGYEQGLENAVALAERLQNQHGLKLELMVAGAVTPELQAHWQARAGVPLVWAGLVPGGDIPHLDRSAHLLFAADLNPACPNSVIEALACGLPVAAFDTGALAELVTGDAGRIAPYGGDPWRLEPPDIPALAVGAAEILADNPRFRQAARARAEAAFGLGVMVDRYVVFIESFSN